LKVIPNLFRDLFGLYRKVVKDPEAPPSSLFIRTSEDEEVQDDFIRGSGS
jgi:hypothetical protein